MMPLASFMCGASSCTTRSSARINNVEIYNEMTDNRNVLCNITSTDDLI